jgi:hypothetical protein
MDALHESPVALVIGAIIFAAPGIWVWTGHYKRFTVRLVAREPKTSVGKIRAAMLDNVVYWIMIRFFGCVLIALALLFLYSAATGRGLP